MATELGTSRSALRYRPLDEDGASAPRKLPPRISDTTALALGLRSTTSRRGSRPAAMPECNTRLPRQATYQEQEEYYTDDDQALQPNLRRRRPVPIETEPTTNPRGAGRRDDRCREWKLPRRRRLHPFFGWLAGIMLILALGWWIVGTAGASWWVSHMSDPGAYGVLHGQAVTGNFVESQTTPITVIGIICHYRVQIIVVNGNNSKLYIGPDLSTNGFPDPDAANVQLQAGQYGGGHLDLKITILSDQFPTPFSRFTVVEFLYGDGNGNLKPTL